MLMLTNHPMIDVGIAVIVSHFDLDDPADVTKEQLKEFAQYLEKTYSSPYFHSFLSVLFPNSAYVNPTMKEERKREALDEVLYGFLKDEEGSNGTCSFCGQPSHFRAFRQHVPLLTGEGLINFFPSRRTGLEICPYCLLAVQAFPLGSLKISGQAFFVHADDFNVTIELAHRFKLMNEQNALLKEAKASPDMKYPKTQFIRQFLEVDRFLKYEEPEGSVTIYHLTNYGTNADISMYHLPVQILSFVYDMKSAAFYQTWQQMAHDAWGVPSKKGKKGEKGTQSFNLPNRLYEDLFDLPAGYASFIRTHLVEGAIRRYKSLLNGKEKDILHYWEIGKHLMKEVVQVREEKIEEIKQMADRLVEYLLKTDDHHFFQRFYHLRNRNKYVEYEELRNLFIKANNHAIRHGANLDQSWELPITFDQFINVFEQWEDPYEGNWQVGRDLILIRMMEQLYEKKWFTRHREILKESEPEEDENQLEKEEA